MKLEWQDWGSEVMNWDEAVKYTDSLVKEGWRLPTIKELKRIMLNDGYDDSGENIFFNYYGDSMYLREVGVWSSTESKNDKGYAYCGDPVDIDTEIRPKDEEFRVILCRKTS